MTGCVVCDIDEHDKFKDRANMFQVGLLDSCFESPGCCLYGYFCGPCAACTMRKRVLQNDMSKYTCCQGYFLCCCIDENTGANSGCPSFLLCLEATCCLSCSMSASRALLQDTYQLRTDPCDRKIICCQQICALASCIFSVMSIFIEECAPVAEIVRLCSDCLFMTIMGCMTAQMDVEMKHQGHLLPPGSRPPVTTEPQAMSVPGQPVAVTTQPNGPPPPYALK